MEKMTYTSSTNAEPKTLFDYTAHDRPLKHIPPIPEQSELESRRVWHKVTEALLSGDHSAASKEKTEIEERQRALRRQRAEKNEEWAPKYVLCAESSSTTTGGSLVSPVQEHGGNTLGKPAAPSKAGASSLSLGMFSLRSSSSKQAVKNQHPLLEDGWVFREQLMN